MSRIFLNSVHNSTCTFYEWSQNPAHAKFFRIFPIISVLTVLVVVVILGNALVIAAVLLRRRLRSATGILILSLGIADLLVGSVILPFSIANEVLNGYWIFGEAWCTIWLTMDIWMCTASIYNLVAISIDRYIAIIKPLNYPILVTKFRARCTVAVVWMGSFIICSPSFFLASSIKDINQEPCKCTPANAGHVYIAFSASSSFYVPMIIVTFVYFRIYIAARRATKSMYSGIMQVTKMNKNTRSHLINHPNLWSKDPLPILRVHRGTSMPKIRSPYLPSRINAYNGSDAFLNEEMKLQRGSNVIPSRVKQDNEGMCPASQLSTSERRSSQQKLFNLKKPKSQMTAKQEIHQPLTEQGKSTPTQTKLQLPAKLNKNPLKKIIRRMETKNGSAYEKRLSVEIKAAKTVAIVTGCFIFCWLGFSLLYGLELQANDVVWSVLFWLGYLNSALNPIIYTVFNREFRLCFKRLLTCHYLNHPNITKVSQNHIFGVVCLEMTFQIVMLTNKHCIETITLYII
uniref:G_PROTEIN_RECEP_F1_2 domain-containing protein n=1 Tax=Angiostrongylus cantonensis TaxID=6313 RepID=A0A0K0DPW6_ANGCA